MRRFGAFTGRTWAALLGPGLVSQSGSYLAGSYALGKLPATLSSVGLLAQVPLTALLTVPLLGEPITSPQISAACSCLRESSSSIDSKKKRVGSRDPEEHHDSAAGLASVLDRLIRDGSGT
jgi:drug/metabolite transporter (DMT)-like permease